MEKHRNELHRELKKSNLVKAIKKRCDCINDEVFGAELSYIKRRVIQEQLDEILMLAGIVTEELKKK